MMYPRLYLARNLLRDDGVIFVSIDDNEVHNLRMMMNEIFGEENFIAVLCWEGAIKNDSRFVSVSHDYVVCYTKNKDYLTVNKTRWRTRKEGIDDIYKKVDELKNEFRDDYNEITVQLREWYKLLSKNDKAWYHRHYNSVDKRGVYFPGDISWPGSGGPRYEILHPKTKKPVRIPTAGWRISKKEDMLALIDEDRIEFGANENKVPTIKRYLHETEGQVIPSIFYRDRRAAAQKLNTLLGRNIFDNPKDEYILKKLFEAITNDEDIILDFFAGSGSTAHAVLKLNKEDGGNRKFILVQLPEKTKEDSEAYKAGYKTIADICKERIRRVIKKLKTENEQTKDKNQTELELNEDQLSKNLKRVQVEAMGFKVFKLVPSNFKMWRSDIVETEKELEKMIDMFETQVKDGSKEENMLYELIIKSGYQLTDKIEKKNGYYSVQNDELIIVLKKIKQKQIDKIINNKPKRCIMLDDVFAENDQLKTNTALQMKDAAIEFKTV